MESARRLLVVLALGAALTAVAGCSGLESAGAPPGDADAALAASGKAAKPAREREWRGGQAVRYERSYRVCSVFSVREIARELGVPAKARVAARAHAQAWYPPQFQRAAFEGCIDGFERRPSGIA